MGFALLFMNSHTILRQKTITGIIWNFLQQLLRNGIQIVTTFLLTWFLVPADFGLMAMISVFFAIANSLMDSGFSQALIQKKEVSQTDYSTAFYTNLVLGLLAYTLLFISAPLIASFYLEPRLVVLVRVVGLVVIINSFQMVQVADLTRRLNFKVQFSVILPAALLSGVIAISMALMGFGIWSLVAQILASALASTALYWFVNEWRPSIDFSVASLREMFSFGSKLFISGLIDTVFNNLYVIFIGKFFSATVLGYYYFAQQIEVFAVSQLSGAIQIVSYPALAILQDDDISLKAFYRKIIQVVTYIVFPCMIALAVLAEPLFHLLLKEDWLPAVPYLQLLCLVGLLYPLHAINLNILKVKGRSDLFLYLEIVKFIMNVIVLLFSVQYGIFGILIGQIILSVLEYIPNSYFSIKLIDYSALEQLRDFIPTLLVATAMGFFMYILGLVLPLDGFVYLLVVGLYGLMFYVTINYMLKIQAQLMLILIIREKYFKKEQEP
jgi:O-antigen/teichoic acid export membrane protein